MAGEEGPQATQSWTFAEEALARAREAAHSSAKQALLRVAAAEVAEVAERRTAVREQVRPLDFEEGCRLVLFYAQKLPELCALCGAPSEVRWTAIIFYRRFFALRSPMEFDPMPMMLASLHLACKIEEVHEITLDGLLEAAEMGGGGAMEAKVAALELPLLECLGFAVLVEPKPDGGLQVLAEDLQRLLWQQRGGSGACPLAEAIPPQVLRRAEQAVLQLSVRTDAVLRWPTSVLLATALSVALDDAAAAGGGNWASCTVPSDALASLLDASLETEPQRVALRGMVEEALRCLRGPACSHVVAQEAVQETAIAARRCHRAFDRLREEATDRHEAHRKERKRLWSQMKRRQVPTPVHHAPVMKAAAIRGAGPGFPPSLPGASAAAGAAAAAAEAFGLAGCGTEGFVIRRQREDMEDD